MAIQCGVQTIRQAANPQSKIKSKNKLTFATAAMTTVVATISSKGQLVLPKPIRDALQLRAGSQVSVRTEGSCVILEPHRPEWTPLNPRARALSTRELCAPVDLANEG